MKKPPNDACFGEPIVVVRAPDGNFVREIGKNLYACSFRHSMRIDKD